MKHASKLVRVIVAVLALAGLIAAALPADAETSDGNYIVVLKDSVGSAQSVAAEHSRRHGTRTSFVYEDALKGYAATINSGRLGALRSDPRVKYVEADGVATIQDTQSPATWGLDRIDQISFSPPSNSFTYSADGTGVTTYIIDTGIRYTHSEFGSRASFGYDAINAANLGNDCHGHGTHVAGTVGGTNYGVAKNVNLVAVRVLDCNGSGSYAQVIAGINWVTGHHATRSVANMSLGGGYSSSLNTAVTNSINVGVSYAVAAGNSNANACNYSPSSTPAALTIAASDSSDKRASFSNYGSCVDWYAPGVGITSSTNSTDFSTGTWSGTSMASPHTAGVAALYLSSATTTDFSPAGVTTALFNSSTKDLIIDSYTRSGKGRNRTTTANLKPLLFTDY